MREADESRRIVSNLTRLWPLLGRCVAFHKRLVDLTGNVKASLMLSQAIYWTRHGQGIRQRDGWFFKTVGQWQRETGLSRHEQANARAVLRKLGILEEGIHGLPARLYFRLDAERLAGLFSEKVGRHISRVDWDDQVALSALLGPVVAFHGCLSSVTGSINAALLLSRAIYCTRNMARQHPQGWFARSTLEWREETGLSRREQERARALLRDLGIIEETLKGVPPQRFTRVNVARLIELLRQSTAKNVSEIANLHQTGNQECGDATFQNGANRQARMWESHNSIWRKAANKVAGKRHNSEPVWCKLYIEKLSTSTTSTKPPPLTPSDESSIAALDTPRGGGELTFPKALLPEERTAAEVLVMRCPQHAQAMLDELAGRMNINAIRLSPIGYLRALLKQAQAGQFIPEVGVRVAAARLKHQEEAALREKQEAERARHDAERESPDYQAKVEKRQAEVRAMLDAMKKRQGGRRTQ